MPYPVPRDTEAGSSNPLAPTMKKPAGISPTGFFMSVTHGCHSGRPRLILKRAASVKSTLPGHCAHYSDTTHSALPGLGAEQSSQPDASTRAKQLLVPPAQGVGVGVAAGADVPAGVAVVCGVAVAGGVGVATEAFSWLTRVCTTGTR